MLTGLIFDIKRYAIHDGPGIRTTVFFKGCPLTCAWCHNPESWQSQPQPSVRVGRCLGCGLCVDQCEHHAITVQNGKAVTDAKVCVRCGACVDACLNNAREVLGREMTVEQVLMELEKDRVFYEESQGGVTFSGGEPLEQADFLCALLAACDARQLHTAVDTTCYAEPDVLERVARQTCLFLCDLKHMDSDQHEFMTGVRNERILSNIQRLSDWNKPLCIRLPLIPGYNDSDTNIRQTADFIRSLRTVQRVDVLPYNRAGMDKTLRLGMGAPELKDFGRSDDPHVASVVDKFNQAGVDVKIGG